MPFHVIKHCHLPPTAPNKMIEYVEKPPALLHLSQKRHATEVLGCNVWVTPTHGSLTQPIPPFCRTKVYMSIALWSGHRTALSFSAVCNARAKVTDIAKMVIIPP